MISANCGGSSSPTAPGIINLSVLEAGSESLVNEERSRASVSQVGHEDPIQAVARAYSEAMRDQGFFDHIDPQGRDLGDRLRDAGVSFRFAGETIARITGAGDPVGSAHSQLMTSPSHRDVILGTDFELVGVGIAKEGGSYWFTHILIHR